MRILGLLRAMPDVYAVDARRGQLAGLQLRMILAFSAAGPAVMTRSVPRARIESMARSLSPARSTTSIRILPFTQHP